MDDNNIDDYAAWTLTPVFYGPEQDFDIIWLGAYRDGNAMGQDMDIWLTSGGELQAAFDKVVKCNAHLAMASAMYKAPADGATPSSGFMTMMDCKLNEGHRYSDIKEAEMKWAEHLTRSAPTAGYWHWTPVYGGGDAEFDYKVVFAYPTFADIGADFGDIRTKAVVSAPKRLSERSTSAMMHGSTPRRAGARHNCATNAAAGKHCKAAASAAALIHYRRCRCLFNTENPAEAGLYLRQTRKTLLQRNFSKMVLTGY